MRFTPLHNTAGDQVAVKVTALGLLTAKLEGVFWVLMELTVTLADSVQPDSSVTTTE